MRISVMSSYRNRPIVRACIYTPRGGEPACSVQPIPPMGSGYSPPQYRETRIDNGWWMVDPEDIRPLHLIHPTLDHTICSEDLNTPGIIECDEFLWTRPPHPRLWLHCKTFIPRSNTAAIEHLVLDQRWVSAGDTSPEFENILIRAYTDAGLFIPDTDDDEGYAEYKNRKEFFSKY
jgi:hypothetical protein